MTIAVPVFEPDNDQAALPLPDAAVTGELREVLRIWAGRDPSTHKQVVATTARTIYPQLGEWNNIILAISRTIVRDMNIGRAALTENELDEAVFSFLGDICEILVAKGAAPEISQEIEGIVSHIENPNAVVVQDRQMSAESITHGHPGALGVPIEIMQDPEWQQIVSIWYQAETENCVNCGEDHTENMILTGNSKVMSHEKFGRLLGSMASAHAAGTTETEEARIKALAEVERNFHDFLSNGMTKQ